MYNITDDYLNEMIMALRVNRTATSEAEVYDLIQAALADIGRQGAITINPTDPLIKHAVRLYCRANYGYDSGAERDRFQTAYEGLSASIALDYDYKDGDAT